MKEATFKAETEEELYKLAKAFCDGFLKNSISYEDRFKQLNPIGKEIVKNKNGQAKTLTVRKKYIILGISYGNNILILNDKGVEKRYDSYLFENVDYPDKDIYK